MYEQITPKYVKHPYLTSTVIFIVGLTMSFSLLKLADAFNIQLPTLFEFDEEGLLQVVRVLYILGISLCFIGAFLLMYALIFSIIKQFQKLAKNSDDITPDEETILWGVIYVIGIFAVLIIGFSETKRIFEFVVVIIIPVIYFLKKIRHNIISQEAAMKDNSKRERHVARKKHFN